MKKVDLTLSDSAIEHQLNLLRYTAGEQKKVIALLTQMQKELKAKLYEGLTDFGKARVNALLKETTAIIDSYYADMQGTLDLQGLVKHEAEFTAQTISTIGLEAALPTEAVLGALIKDNLLSGAPLKAWWQKQSDDLAFKYSSALRQGVAQGETLQDIITRVVGSPKKGITGIMDVSRRNASTLVHDSIMQISNSAKLETYKANADILNGVQWLATFDSHICPACAALSGATWDLDGNPINGTKQPFQSPPLHPNDRCVLTPVTKSFKELGINISEPVGTRASDEGQIPSDTTFAQFLSRKTVAEQNEMLGVGRADLWRKKVITLQDLISGNNRPLTLGQLNARYAA